MLTLVLKCVPRALSNVLVYETVQQYQSLFGYCRNFFATAPFSINVVQNI